MIKGRVYIADLGSMDYLEAWELQDVIFQSSVSKKLYNRDHPESVVEPDHFLLFVEHPHVYTLGKSGSASHLIISEQMLEKIGATYYKINRGGDITYHGPGQLVFYPIMDLDQFFTDIHLYLRLLEDAVIDLLKEYGVEAGRIKGLTGVWIDGEHPLRARKICAMGIRCSRWITMHGIALNVNTDLIYFNHIVPCGIVDKKVTSLDQEIGRQVDMQEIQVKFLHHFKRLFNITRTIEIQQSDIPQFTKKY